MSSKQTIKAVGYARRSTDMQERSIPDQKTFVERWAKENSYRIERWYIDDAISGTSTKGRVAFERMIADAEGGGSFSVVLCYDISRFSRGGTNETGFYLHRLHVTGVDAIFCAEGIPEGEEGELLQGVKSWQARQYSVKLSRDSIRGSISHIMDKHCAPGGTAPYGFDKQHCTAAGQVLRTFRWLPDGRKQEFGPDGQLIRVLETGESVKKAKSDIVRFVPSSPDRVAVVKRIFDLCIEGYGYYHIANRLNNEGVPCPNGGYWLSSRISRILSNPVYRGAIAWNRRTMGKINGVARDGTLRPKRGWLSKNNPKVDWFVVEDVHEPIVSPERFEQARNAVRSRRDEGGRAKPVHRSLLSGLIICNNCGHHFLQRHSNSTAGGKRVRYRYYADGGYNRGGKSVCVGSNIPADALDIFVVGKIRDTLRGDSDGATKAVEAFVEAAMMRHQNPSVDDAVATQRDVDALSRRIKSMVAMLADPAFTDLDELKTTLADLTKRRDVMRTRLVQRKAASPAPYTESDLRDWATDRFRRIDKIITGRSATPEARRLVNTFVDRIEIDPQVKRGTIYLPADAMACLEREVSTRGAHGEARGRRKREKTGNKRRGVVCFGRAFFMRGWF